MEGIQKEENNKLKHFLQETKYCDFSHPSVKEIAHKIADNYPNERDKAINLFYWVRDNILYQLGHWQRKASETLKEKKGGCTSKANLLVALLRANNIPAGYGVMKVKAQEYFGPIAIPLLKEFASKISTHIYCGVYLENKWIKCDPSDDRTLSENTFYINPQSKLVEWDGIHDAMLNLDKDHILGDNFPLANIDSFISKKPHHAKGIPLKVANIFVKFLRENKKRVNNIGEIEFLFKKWLKVHYPFYYYLISIMSWYKDLKSKIKQ